MCSPTSLALGKDSCLLEQLFYVIYRAAGHSKVVGMVMGVLPVSIRVSGFCRNSSNSLLLVVQFQQQAYHMKPHIHGDKHGDK